MGQYLLIAAGVAFAALFALNNLLKTVFRRNRVGFVDLLLAFLVALVPLSGLILAQIRDTPDARVPQAALLLGAALAVFSLLLMLLELFRAQRWKGSRGILGMVTGLLLMLASVTVPLSASLVAQQGDQAAAGTPAPTAAAQLPQGEAPETEAVDDDPPTPSPTPTRPPATETPTTAPTETPRPTRTPSATRFLYSTRTPTATLTAVTPCVASVEYNLRLRAAPNTESETLLVIPFGTTVELYGRGAASENEARWWVARYEGQEGWLDGQYLLVGSACDALPLRESD